jgi:L-asparaginase II
VPLVEVDRGGRLECVHFGTLAVCDSKGRVLLARGDPETATYLRSSAKPFQAATVIQTGAADRYHLTAEELALCCASHGAQPIHLSVVQSILDKCDFKCDDLQCGPQVPAHGPSAEALAHAGLKPDRIHNNCSGKHAGMLAVCRHLGWPSETYLQADHPLQQANIRSMAAFAGVEPAQIPLGIDGCGVPTFYLPVSRIATAFARLANAEASPPPYADAARRITQAMVAHPVLVGYEGQFGAILMESVKGLVIGKGGAEGVFGLGLVGRGIGIACKIGDGASRAIPPLMVALLERFLEDVDLTALRQSCLRPVLNTRGEEVGELRVVIS